MRNFILAILATTVLYSCSNNPTGREVEEEIQPAQDKGSNAVDQVHTRWGTPVDATPENDSIFQRHQYIFSYDWNRNVTNWVAWELSDAWYGDAERFDGNFKTDPILPDDWYKVRHDDYTNGGFDRGHLVRSEERTLNDDDNLSTFYTTNILPMTADLNRGPWLRLEYDLEEYLKMHPEVTAQVYAGGIFTTNRTVKDEGIIPIPDTLWKAVHLFTSNKEIGLFGIKMPNIDGIRDAMWYEYEVNIDAIETSTGYDLFYSIHDLYEEEWESGDPFWEGKEEVVN